MALIAAHHPSVAGPAILGGGIAGIAAAVQLAQAGVPPILIESRPYLGGRLRSFVHEGTGDEIDNGQHLLMGCYHATFQLLEALGTRGLVELAPTLTVEFRDPDGSRDSIDSPRWLPAPLNVLAGMLRLRRLTLAQRLRLLRVGMAIRSKRNQPTPDETATEYLQRLGQSRAARQRLWDPIIIATLNTPADEASATLFAAVMRRAFLGGKTESQLGFVRGGLSALHGPARAFITRHGGSVMTGAPITRIEQNGDGTWTVFLKERQPIVASHLISALPHSNLRGISPPGIIQQIPSLAQPMPTSPIVSLYLWFNTPLHEMPMFAAMIGTGVQWVFNKRKIMAAGNEKFPGLISCTISAAVAEAATDATQIVRHAEQELRGAFPELRGATLVAHQVIKEKHATFAATPQNEAARTGPGTLIPGLYLAGDWTATGLPGTIEGGAQSGVAAANQLLAELPHR